MHHRFAFAVMGLLTIASCHVNSRNAGDLGTFIDHADKPAAPEAPRPVPDAAAADSCADGCQPQDAGTPSSMPKGTKPPAVDAWTMLGYDLGSTYNNTAEKIISKETAAKLRVKYEVPAGFAIYGAPLIADGKVIFNGSDEIVAVDAERGAVLWRKKLTVSGTYEPSMTNSMAYEDGTLYVQSNSTDLWALRAADGSELWNTPRLSQQQEELGYSSVIVASERLLLGRSSNAEFSNGPFRGNLVAHDKLTGEQSWLTYTVPDGANGAGIWSTPTVDLELGLVYATTGNNLTEPATDSADAFMAFDLASGEVRFTRPTMKDVASFGTNAGTGWDFGANPVLYEAEVAGVATKLMAAGSQGGWTYAVNRETGELVWSRLLGPSDGMMFVGHDSGDRGIHNNGAWTGKYLLFAVNGGSEPDEVPTTLFALEGATGDIAWQRPVRTRDAVLGRITVANGVGFVGVGSHLEVFDVDDGSLIQSIETSGGTAAGVASIANGLVAFGTGAAWLRYTDAEKGALTVLEVPR
jgi:polyvinyl alcohol dehydrogenase (cytochrome)